jgi:acetolactate synthase-1/2/3 large subunit
LGSPDLEALAACFGLDYAKATNCTELEAILVAINAGRSRIILDIRMDDDDYRGPAIVTKFREDGTPYSSDIEDIAWRIPE